MSGDPLPPPDYQGRRRRPADAPAALPALPPWAAHSPRLVFLGVLAVAVCVVVAVNALSSGARPRLVMPAPTVTVGISGTGTQTPSLDARPDSSRPARSSPRPSPSPGQTRSSAPPPPVVVTPSPSPASYEAEAPGNTRGTEVDTRDVAAASGGKVVGWIGNRPSATLRFNGVQALYGGRYTLTIFYLSGETRSASISVNGGTPTMLAFSSTGGFNRVGSRTFNVDLTAGVNTIEFGNPSNWAPDFDRIVV